MPTRDEHVAKAKGNEEFAATITPDTQAKVDWLLIVLFYAGVHYVEAYLHKHFGAHVRSHTTRDRWIGKDTHLKKIYTSYSHLKFYGYNARYELYGFKMQDTVDASKYLNAIKTSLTPLL